MNGPFTLSVDVGGTHIKASVLDRSGALESAPVRQVTPSPATPQAVLDCIADLARQLPAYDRISIGFPGVVRGGQVATAPNLGTAHWAGFALIDAAWERFRAPARVLNDAAVQGLGVVEGPDLDCVITLGTGVGCALFRNRRFLLHLEFGQFSCHGETYDRYVGQAAYATLERAIWNERVRETIADVIGLTSCDVLYVGGGNAKKIAFALPENVRVVDNAAGITGGVRLWEPELDELFHAEPHAHVSAQGDRP